MERARGKHEPHRKHHFQQVFYCCMRVCCGHHVTGTEPLPSDGSMQASQFWVSADVPQHIRVCSLTVKCGSLYFPDVTSHRLINTGLTCSKGSRNSPDNVLTSRSVVTWGAVAPSCCPRWVTRWKIPRKMREERSICLKSVDPHLAMARNWEMDAGRSNDQQIVNKARSSLGKTVGSELWARVEQVRIHCLVFAWASLYSGRGVYVGQTHPVSWQMEDCGTRT
jgi:hypothetical protein